MKTPTAKPKQRIRLDIVLESKQDLARLKRAATLARLPLNRWMRNLAFNEADRLIAAFAESTRPVVASQVAPQSTNGNQAG